MNTQLALFALSLGKFELVLYGVGAVVVLMVAILLLNFGMIYIRALFSGAKVTFTDGRIGVLCHQSNSSSREKPTSFKTRRSPIATAMAGSNLARSFLSVGKSR